MRREAAIRTDKRINEAITAKEVRLIGEAGEQFGIVSREQAFFLAADVGLDLLEVSAEGMVPPVVRILNLGKYQYEEEKRARKQRVQNRGGDMKEIKLSYKIDEHDFQTKLRRAQQFLAKGDRVKVYVQLRGRENIFAEQAKDNVVRFAKELGSTVESISKQGNRITAILK